MALVCASRSRPRPRYFDLPPSSNPASLLFTPILSLDDLDRMEEAP